VAGQIAEIDRRLVSPAFNPGQLAAIVDASPDGITVQAADGHIVFANDAAARASGYSSVEEFLGAPVDDVVGGLELVDEEGTPLARRDLPGETVLRGGTETSRVVGFRDRRTGEQRWAAVTATPLYDRSGRVEYAVNAFHDITARMRAEADLRRQRAEARILEGERDGERERLSAILSERVADEVRLAELVRSERARAAELNAIIGAIGEGIVVIDRSGNVTLANRTAQRLLASGDLRTLADLLGRLELPAEIDLASLVTDGPRQARLSDGGGRWIELATYPVDASAEMGAGETIVVLRDVTEAREREQARDAFIGVLSHELRTPVTTIYAGAMVLARSETKLDEEARTGIFEDIHAEAERLHRLVEDVVALTRFGEGAVEIGNEPVLLQRVLPAVVRSEQGRWPGRTVELDLPLDLPPVAGETTYVEQVVRNLLANAMKYGGPSAAVRIEALEAESGKEVEVRVLDSGPGFPEAEADRLFELYYRSPTMARKVSGSGIGLFVCARLIGAMGGRVWAANRPTGGAEFGFALRVMPADR
jgi:PAS domain S-box-containing protein